MLAKMGPETSPLDRSPSDHTESLGGTEPFVRHDGDVIDLSRYAKCHTSCVVGWGLEKVHTELTPMVQEMLRRDTGSSKMFLTKY